MTMGDDPAAAARPPNQPPDDDNRTPFQRFEDMLRKVVSVPKSEIDEKRRHER